MLHSTEYEDSLISSDYQTYLGRAAAPSEVAGWASQMQGGMTAEQVADDFLTSAEFNADHADDNSFVLALYEDVLGRAPAPGEIAAWTGELASGMTRGTVVADVLGSTEAAEHAVQGLYQALLGRPADSAGLAVNAGLLQSGVSQADLAAAIVASPEFVGLARDAVG
jgi:hypothetical protein